jgi:hypothetical protein
MLGVGTCEPKSNRSAAPGLRCFGIAALALVVMAATVATAAGQAEAPVAADRPIGFDIPVQPLAAALEAFSAVSGYQILVADAGSATSLSKAIKGVLSPREALAQMTSGTGLEIRFTSARAAILIHDVGSQIALIPAPPRRDQEAYDAALQNDLMAALCRDAATRPGRYRTALDLWVASSGHVDRAELLSSTGDTDRDQRIVATLRQLNLAPPPPGLALPVTLLLLSKASNSTQMCEAPPVEGTTPR